MVKMVITETVMKVIPEVHQIANRYLRVALLFTVLLAIPSLCQAWSGKVVYVADGDTFDVERDGKKVRVRLYGVDTPESTQAFGQNAIAFTSSQIMGKVVDVQKIETAIAESWGLSLLVIWP